VEAKCIKDLAMGDEMVGFYALRKIELKAKADGGKFLRLEFGDQTGRIQAVQWEEAEATYDTIQTGDVVKVKGRVDKYQDVLQVKVEKVRKAEIGEYEANQFLPVIEKDREKLFQQLKGVIETIKNPFLKKLLDAFFSDRMFVQAFMGGVGGKLWHHAYVGGLLEHTLTVVTLCQQASQVYELVDRDLLLTGAILHDVGKIREYTSTTFIEFSDEGRLRGHIVIGDELAQGKIRDIPNFPDELRKKISHMILAHQGHLEFGSPVVPMMLESIILFYCDELDSKANAFSRIIQKEGKSNKKWSDWVNLMERFIYLGEGKKPGAE
jgi:3'-5' exoribonuclease